MKKKSIKPLWFVKYDPIRTMAVGKGSMRFISKPFKQLKVAKKAIKALQVENPQSFREYAVLRWTEEEEKIILQGKVDNR